MNCTDDLACQFFLFNQMAKPGQGSHPEPVPGADQCQRMRE